MMYPMNYEQVSKPSFTIVGIKIKTDNKRGMEDFPAHWRKFYSEGIEQQIPNKIDDEVIALYTEYEGDHTQPFSFVIGCRVSKVGELPAGLTSAFIPEQTYAQYNASGLFPDCLIKTWMEIWGSTYKRAYQADFEVYSPRTEDKCFIGDEKNVQVFVALD